MDQGGTSDYSGTLNAALRRMIEIRQDLDAVEADLESARGLTDNGHQQNQIRILADRLRSVTQEITYTAEETIGLLPEGERVSSPMARAWNEAYARDQEGARPE